MRIAEASERSGISIDTLRYYEKEGLISPARRGAIRDYSEEDLDVLDMIAQLRNQEFSIPDIRKLLAFDALFPDIHHMSSEQLARIREFGEFLDARLETIAQRRAELAAIEKKIRRMRKKLDLVIEHEGVPE